MTIDTLGEAGIPTLSLDSLASKVFQSHDGCAELDWRRELLSSFTHVCLGKRGQGSVWFKARRWQRRGTVIMSDALRETSVLGGYESLARIS